MRNLVRLILIGAFAASTVAATAVSAGAGSILRVNRVTVVKVVDGPVTPGTTFTVAVDCAEVSPGSVGAAAEGHTDITFDDTGQPTSPDTVTTFAFNTCTVTETVNGGATSTTYACEIAPAAAAVVNPASCGEDGMSVEFGSVLGDTATITVTNTFPTPKPSDPPVVQAIQATPTFTG